MSGSGWIGVDFDGTLAHYEGWKGPEHVGAPIGPMVARVRAWLDAGQEVRIFTARIYPYVGVLQPDQPMPLRQGYRWQNAFLAACAIGDFCRQHLGRGLPITCVKDMDMIELWDDRAVHVRQNLGLPLGFSRVE